eukprot:gene13237-28002_t
MIGITFFGRFILYWRFIIYFTSCTSAQKLWDHLNTIKVHENENDVTFHKHKPFSIEELGPIKMRSSQCEYPDMEDALQIPILFINLDHAIERKEQFLKRFGCLNITRIPGILGRNLTEISKWMSNPISTTPSIAESSEGEKEWDGLSQRNPPKILSSEFLGALGCILAHLRAIATIQYLNLPYAIIMEDDMTPEVYPYWSDLNINFILYQLPSTWSAIELSAITGPKPWDELYENLNTEKRGISIIENKWLASNGAYAISSKGANEIINSLIDHSTMKFDLTHLLCIQADLCMTEFFKEKYLYQPSLFLHEKTYINTTSSSIVNENIKLMELQHYTVELARNKSIEFNKNAYNHRQNFLNSANAREVPKKKTYSPDPSETQNTQGISTSGKVQYSNKFYGTIDRYIAHLRAAAAMLLQDKSYGLILEDEISLDLIQYWNMSQGLHNIIKKLPPDTSVVQLSIVTDENSWESVNHHINDAGKSLLKDVWFPTVGAYLLTKRGAMELIASVNYTSGKFDLRYL